MFNYMKKVCKICNKSFEKPYSCSKKEWEKRVYCSKPCKYADGYFLLGGSKNPNYKGGTINRAGYRIINVLGKRTREHRDIIEKFIGRKLKSNEVIHHINGNRLDNRLENLKIMNKKEHHRLHYPKGSKFGATLSRPILTPEERKRKQTEYFKQYRLKNKEKLKLYFAIYHKNHKVST